MDIRKFLSKKRKVSADDENCSNTAAKKNEISTSEESSTVVAKRICDSAQDVDEMDNFAINSIEVYSVSESLESSAVDHVPSTSTGTNKPSSVRNNTALRHQWITRTADGFYCTYCKLFSVHNQSNQGVWIDKPFTKRKKLYLAADKHSESALHKQAVLTAKLSESANSGAKGDVANQCRAYAAERAVTDRDVLRKLFHAAYFLFKNEISHTTNWQSILQLMSDTDFSCRIETFLASRPRNATYQSATSITGFMESISAALDEKLVSNIAASISKFGFYSLMADEETNMANEQVLSVCVRFLAHDSASVIEQFLAACPVVNTTAETVSSAIADMCHKRSLPMNKISALSFDGASNMSGRHGGVQALLKEKYCPRAMFIHCRSHRLQLVLKNASNDCKSVKLVISCLGSFYKLFSSSPKQLRQLFVIEEALGIRKLKAVEPSPTRWLGYEMCVKRVLEIYPAVLATLEHLHMDAGDLSSTAGGLLLTFRKRSTIFVLTVLDDWLRALAKLSRMFQTAAAELSQAVTLTQATIDYIDNFEFTACQERSTALIDLCESKGLHVEKDAFTDRQPLLQFKTKIVNNLRNRFNDDASNFLGLYKLFDNVSEPIAERTDDTIKSILKNSPAEIVASEVSAELQIYRRWLKLESITGKTAKENMFDLVFGAQATIFPSLSKLAISYLLLPLGTATVERSFSTLNRIACAERSSLSSEHQDCLLRISAEGSESLTEELLDLSLQQWFQAPHKI